MLNMDKQRQRAQARVRSLSFDLFALRAAQPSPTPAESPAYIGPVVYVHARLRCIAACFTWL